MALLTFFSFSNPTIAYAPLVPSIGEVYTPLSEAEEIELLVKEYATLYNLNYSHFRATLYCESRLNPRAVGDGGNSYGIAQIHLPSHRDVTRENALEPDWAIRWAAQQWAKGGQGMWTCYRLLYGA